MWVQFDCYKLESKSTLVTKTMSLQYLQEFGSRMRVFTFLNKLGEGINLKEAGCPCNGSRLAQGEPLSCMAYGQLAHFITSPLHTLTKPLCQQCKRHTFDCWPEEGKPHLVLSLPSVSPYGSRCLQSQQRKPTHQFLECSELFQYF